jgi:hypothetical protein
VCARRGEWHDELPFAYGVPAPRPRGRETNVHTQPIGQRPLIELQPTDHPLAVEQRQSITRARVQELAEQLLHDG